MALHGSIKISDIIFAFIAISLSLSLIGTAQHFVTTGHEQVLNEGVKKDKNPGDWELQQYIVGKFW